MHSNATICGSLTLVRVHIEDFSELTKIKAPKLPPARYHHTTIYDEKDTSRGLRAKGTMKDTWIFNFGFNQQKNTKQIKLTFLLVNSEWTLVETKGTPPKARYGHASAIVDKYLYVFGGMHKSKKYVPSSALNQGLIDFIGNNLCVTDCISPKRFEDVV